MSLKPKIPYSITKMKPFYRKPSSKYWLNNIRNSNKMELIDEAPAKSLKRALSQSDEESNKKVKINTNISNTPAPVLKNSIQKLYEIKAIQPLDFEMLSSEGPQHKPTFKFCLKFKLNDTQLKFFGEGLNKKAAKTVAAMKALLNLSETNNLFEKDYFKALILNDMKQLNINEPYETYVEVLRRSELNLPNQEQLLVVNDTENETRREESLQMIIESIHDSDMNTDSVQARIEEVKVNKKTTYDLKTREIIATKMPMSIFNHMLASVQSYNFNLLSETGMSHSKLFKMELKIDKNVFTESSVFTTVDVSNLKAGDSLLFTETHTEYSFIGFGASLKIAKSRAAQLALEMLFDIKITSPELEIVPTNNPDLLDSEIKIKEFADNISELAKNKFNNLLSTIEAKASKSNNLLSNITSIFDEEIASSKKLRNVYAAIIQSSGFDYNSSKLICVTTGTKCINGEFMSQMGTAINDCHAEILAIRLLRKYLYKQLNDYIAYLSTNPEEKVSENSIFEIVEDREETDPRPVKPFRLKSNIKFHLFISSAPCGDGRIFSIHDNVPPDNHPNRKVRGLLRTKLESGEGTVPVSNVIEIQTWDGILIGERLKVMSCSDKLCKYNVVGIQGALLSHFVETIYLSSVIVGGYYHKYHLSRALYGRLCEVNKLFFYLLRSIKFRANF